MKRYKFLWCAFLDVMMLQFAVSKRKQILWKQNTEKFPVLIFCNIGH